MPGLSRSDFLLDPEIVFLNHGSFGACPKPVFEEYQRWQLELERQPVEFLGRRYHDLLDNARAELAGVIGADRDEIVFTENATMGVNIVVKSLDLQPGDEVVTSDHEYGACELAWKYLQEHQGVVVTRAAVPLPVTSTDQIVEAIWSAVSPKTKVIYLSHITSFSALRFPIEQISARARAAGIITVIDGAHAPGHINLDMHALDVDFYAGNLHKWFCAPKGAGFLYARPEFHEQMDAGIVSWGWGDRQGKDQPESQYISRNQWQGTRDPASYLAVPAAIKFQREHNWPQMQAECHALVSDARNRISNLTDLPVITPDSTDFFLQMATCPIRTNDIPKLKDDLYTKYKIEIPCMDHNGRQFVRVSIQGYNTPADVDALLEALGALL